MKLLKTIRARTARAGIVGLGYVGLPLAVEFARAGFPTVGIDVDGERIEKLGRGESYVTDVSSSAVRRLISSGRLSVTSQFDVIGKLDTVNICVPTPLRKSRDPDLSCVVSAAEEIKKYLHPGQLVILESTTYPGTTEEIVLPILESTGLKVGKDFFLAFSPERTDPGNKAFTTRNIPKVVGGVTPRCTQMARALYGRCLERVVVVSSPRVAEMVKLLENTFRSVNIALVNEMALMCDRMGINVWEVIEAAKTKPFGFMPFYPGPGLGGHCIPIDPFYLSWKAKMDGFEARFIELAGQVNASMPSFVVEKVAAALNARMRSVKGSKILSLGVAYKRNINDVRESPALDVMDLLARRGALLSYS
ncbi:MAG: nucleotide sugar dehydrogenase, partial [Nitrospinota bacterium]